MRFGSSLTPTLATIERALFGRDDTTPAPDPADDDEIVQPGQAEAVEPGPGLRSLIERRAAAAVALGQPAAPAGGRELPRPGAIWWLRPPAQSGAALALLVSAASQHFGVQGWLVAPETAYASHRDWVLQDEDVEGAALDPRLGMVQLWNSLRVPLQVLEAPATSVTPPALQAILAVAREPAPGPAVQAAPGRIGLVESCGVAWVCGTPLGDARNDPRHRYQQMYRTLAARLAQQSATPAANDGSLPAADARARALASAAAARPPAHDPARTLPGAAPHDPATARRRARPSADFWRGAGVAAALALAVALPLALRRPAVAPSATRAIRIPQAAVTFEVHFVATATMSQIGALLRQAGLQLAGGPDASDAYRLRGAAAQAATARHALDASPLVVSWAQSAR